MDQTLVGNNSVVSRPHPSCRTPGDIKCPSRCRKRKEPRREREQHCCNARLGNFAVAKRGPFYARFPSSGNIPTHPLCYGKGERRTH
ncbi:hypothetical protein TNIN_293581 [Trichonephila inaurata madagascariensis]|uniref:Uncharacterized protein n=1 Tax=Trichonephila inaurata madagascariensis TaxID=2747483 RepID=A0A8X6X133_9ARAC|nr:hypothetical protein TNIN_293581 [Trichonephila inaurata madagascariensis]